MKNRNSSDILRHARERLKAARAGSYALDALVLLAFAVQKPKEWLFAHDYVLTEQEYEIYLKCIEKRALGTPVQYIIRYCEFMGLDFYVDENVLIPRSDTEILVERLINASRELVRPRILDLCTGSGCIAVSAAYYNIDSEITAVDISRQAIETAKKNAELAGVSKRIAFYTGDLFEPLEPIKNKFDIIASNPPYIPKAEIGSLSDEVKKEPYIALCGGDRGLDFYMRIAEGSASLLKEGGLLIFEIGHNQAESVIEIMNKNGYNNINIYRDLAGLDRVAEGVRR